METATLCSRLCSSKFCLWRGRRHCMICLLSRHSLMDDLSPRQPCLVLWETNPPMHLQTLGAQPTLTTLPDQGWACTCMFDMWVAAKVDHARWSQSQVHVQCGSAPVLTVLASLVMHSRPCNVHLNGTMRIYSCSGKLDAGQGSNHISYTAFNSK